MKVGDLVVSNAHSNYVGVVPSRLVVKVSSKILALDRTGLKHIVLEDDPDNWRLAKNFFVVSHA